MADIFISYKTEDRDIARNVARILIEDGHDVWWDQALLVGDTFDAEIKRILRSSRAAVILWSTRSVLSKYVAGEASLALERDVALPVFLDSITIDDLPLPWRTVQYCDLRNWDGSRTHAGITKILRTLAARGVTPKFPPRTPEEADAILTTAAIGAQKVVNLFNIPRPSPEQIQSALTFMQDSAVRGSTAILDLARIAQQRFPVDVPIRGSIPEKLAGTHVTIFGKRVALIVVAVAFCLLLLIFAMSGNHR